MCVCVCVQRERERESLFRGCSKVTEVMYDKPKCRLNLNFLIYPSYFKK